MLVGGGRGGAGELEVSVVSNEESRAALKRRVEGLVCGCAALCVCVAGLCGWSAAA